MKTDKVISGVVDFLRYILIFIITVIIIYVCVLYTNREFHTETYTGEVIGQSIKPVYGTHGKSGSTCYLQVYCPILDMNFDIKVPNDNDIFNYSVGDTIIFSIRVHKNEYRNATLIK